MENYIGTHEILLKFFIAGACGALVHMLVRDNVLVIPRRIDGNLALGFIGPMLIGGFVGIIADGDCVAAALSGYVGSSVLEKFLPFVKIDAINKINAEEKRHADNSIC